MVISFVVQNHGRAYREGGFHIAGSEKHRAMQNIEGVHIFTNSRAWE